MQNNSISDVINQFKIIDSKINLDDAMQGVVSTLVFSAETKKYNCSICGAEYTESDLQRLRDSRVEEFTIAFRGYCMDCGCLWEV